MVGLSAIWEGIYMTYMLICFLCCDIIFHVASMGIGVMK